MTSSAPLLSVEDLSVRYPSRTAPVVDGLAFTVGRGEAVGIVGESGSGKTQTALALMGLLGAEARAGGVIRFNGDVLKADDARAFGRYRARHMAMVFQDPLLSLNPYLTVGRQLILALGVHQRGDLEARAVSLLRRVRFPDPEGLLRRYPHQLSGGMRQRVMIALALAGEPALIIADEPTSALDVSVQARILALLGELRTRDGISLLLVTHDLGVVAGHCDRVLVMENGRLVEQGRPEALFREPSQPATRRLLSALRVSGAPSSPPDGEAILSVSGLAVHYRERRGFFGHGDSLPAVSGMDLELARGETLAVVGESGSGKTTLARAVLGLLEPAAGLIRLGGVPLAARLEARPPGVRRRIQTVFQDPAGSLNPALRIAAMLGELLALHEPELPRAKRRQRIADLLAEVGLDESLGDRRPHELSGGQAQRVAIARALLPRPDVLICDEAVSALDAAIRDEVLELLAALQRRSGLAMIFIAHDLGVVRRIAHRVLVMYQGRVCETADNETIFATPLHPYTQLLLDCRSGPEPAETADALSPARGCPFAPRCPRAIAECRQRMPAPRSLGGTRVSCHRAGESASIDEGGIRGRAAPSPGKEASGRAAGPAGGRRSR